jgi:hypothetical protein
MNNENFFKDKHLLFIDTLSEYNMAIKASFEKQGGTVDFMYSVRGNFLAQLKNRYFTDTSKDVFSKKCTEFLKQHQHTQYDYILIKAPFFLNHDFYEYLVNHFPDVRKVNYNWSSLKMYDYTPFISYFDKVITFDYKDAENKNLIYHPLFYVDEFKNIGLANNSSKRIYDISTVGHAYTVGRYEFLSKFKEYAGANGMNVYYYLYAPWISFIKARISGTYIPNTYSKFLKLKEVCEIISKSKTVVDCQMTIQDGLTMRTFETLGAGRKLITTNENIKKEVFYNTKDIFIVNQDGSTLNNDLIEFIKNDDQVDASKYSDYYIDNWLKKILVEL